MKLVSRFKHFKHFKQKDEWTTLRWHLSFQENNTKEFETDSPVLESVAEKVFFRLLTGFIFKSPWYLIRFACLVAFLLQITTLIAGMINPKETLISTQKVDFDKIDFPLVFKICIKPGFNETELRILGYQNSLGYLFGNSRYNESLFGWAGHTLDGKVVSNVSGNHEKFHSFQRL